MKNAVILVVLILFLFPCCYKKPHFKIDSITCYNKDTLIAITNEGQIITTYNGGHNWEVLFRFLNRTSFGLKHKIKISDDGVIWKLEDNSMGDGFHRNDLYFSNNFSFDWVKVSKFSSDSIYTRYFIKEQNEILLVSKDSIYRLLNPQKHKDFAIPILRHSFYNSYTFSVLRDNKLYLYVDENAIWMTYNNSLEKVNYRNEHLLHFSAADLGKYKDTIYIIDLWLNVFRYTDSVYFYSDKIKQDSRSRDVMLISRENGLYFISRHNIYKYTEGGFSVIINKYKDSFNCAGDNTHGDIWLGGQNGIYCIRNDTLLLSFP